MTTRYQNILVNALVNLGDVVISTGAVALLKKAYPQSRITMLVKPSVCEVLNNNPLIDEVIPFAYRAKENSLSAMWAMVQLLKEKHFDLSVSLDRKLRPALLTWLAGIPVRVGPDKIFGDKPSRVTWLYTDVIPIKHDMENTLQRELYQEIVRGFLNINDSALPRIADITTKNECQAQKLLSELPVGNRYIGLCVKGTFPLKTWPKEYFATVVNKLAEKYGAVFYVTGGPEDKEYADEVISGFGLPAANFCGRTSLMDMAALLQRTDLFVSVDTGGAHIAATTGVPMVVMYGCTSPRRWFPASENARVLTSDEKCCPCSYRPDECPTSPRPACLWNVTPEMVLRECYEFLDKR